jgi:hypothetical protein
MPMNAAMTKGHGDQLGSVITASSVAFLWGGRLCVASAAVAGDPRGLGARMKSTIL